MCFTTAILTTKVIPVLFLNLKKKKIVSCFGLENTNVEGELKVEHVNCHFKAALMHLCGNYTDDSLQRVAKSLDVSACLQEKLLPQYVDRFVRSILINERTRLVQRHFNEAN